MLRGGRSCPSDRKVGTGAWSSGNGTDAGACGSDMPAVELGMGVIEQNAEHMLHLPGLDES